MTLTVGSLFSGIGGIDLGLERAGFEIKFQVELDPYCNRVLARHWPDVPRFGDVREVGAHNLPPVDLLCGGFPCQDVSLAGNRAGLAGKRSGLWSEFARLIRVLRPRYVLVENVPGLLSSGMGQVLGDLAGLGYDAEWESLPAAAFGAPHLRERVFIVAHATGDGLRAERRQAAEQRREREALGRGEQSGGNGSYGAVAHTNEQGLEIRQGVFGNTGKKQPPVVRSGWWATEPDICRVANGVPSRVDRLRGLGNAVVPQAAEWLGRRILAVDAL